MVSMKNTTQQNIRCFVAIEIPKTIQNHLISIQDELRKKIKQASWVKPGNVHLTLKFLGEVNPSHIETIGQTIQQVAVNHSAFSMLIGGMGAFPNLTHPRVIWVGVKVGVTEISALARDINVELSRCGYPFDEKKFNPHLTLARLKSRVNLRPFVDVFRQYDEIDGAKMTVNEIVLVQSQLYPTGAIHTLLKICALN